MLNYIGYMSSFFFLRECFAMIAIMIEIVVDFQNIEHGLIILGLTMYYPCSETLSLLL